MVEIGEMLSAMLQKVNSHIARDKWEYNYFGKYMQEEDHRVMRFETLDFVPREIRNEIGDIMRNCHLQREPQEWRTVECF